MSLHDAVLEIADDLEKDVLLAESMDVIRAQVKSCVKQLRRACTAAGNEIQNMAYGHGAMPPVVLSPAAQHALEIEKYKAEFRKPDSQRIVTEEQMQGGDMIRLLGGPAAPDDVPVYQSVDSNMPIGARTMVAGAPYKLTNTDKGRMLLYDADELQRLKAQQGNG